MKIERGVEARRGRPATPVKRAERKKKEGEKREKKREQKRERERLLKARERPTWWMATTLRGFARFCSNLENS